MASIARQRGQCRSRVGPQQPCLSVLARPAHKRATSRADLLRLKFVVRALVKNLPRVLGLYGVVCRTRRRPPRGRAIQQVHEVAGYTREHKGRTANAHTPSHHNPRASARPRSRHVHALLGANPSAHLTWLATRPLGVAATTTRRITPCGNVKQRNRREHSCFTTPGLALYDRQPLIRSWLLCSPRGHRPLRRHLSAFARRTGGICRCRPVALCSPPARRWTARSHSPAAAGLLLALVHLVRRSRFLDATALAKLSGESRMSDIHSDQGSHAGCAPRPAHPHRVRLQQGRGVAHLCGL